MKNKNFVVKGLFVLIMVLVSVAGVYAGVNKDRIFSYADSKAVSKNEGKSIQNKKDDNSSSIDVVIDSKPDEPEKPDYGSENVSETPGLKVITTYSEFAELANSDKNTFFVFGREGCHYCDLYKPVLKEVANLYKIEIAYVELTKLSNEDYQSVMNSSLVIPAKCSNTGEDVALSKGFGTPLSLFVNNGNTYECIRGYKDNVNLINSLKDIGYVD